MTLFLTGLFTGAVLGIIFGRHLHNPNTKPAKKNETDTGSNSPEDEESERKRKERKEWIEEHERQFFNMMNYTGAKQK